MKPAEVTLKIYEILGREVATLFDKFGMEYGKQVVQFDASGYASGVYFYKLDAVITDEKGMKNTFTSMKKMMLVR